MASPLDRAHSFCARFGLKLPIVLAPLAGACPPSLSIAVANAGSMGACGALLMQPPEILKWAADFRAGSSGPFQINLWIPDLPPVRDPEHEERVRIFLSRFGPPVPPEAADARPPDFAAQCESILEARPSVVSSVMGCYPPELVARFQEARIPWFSTATTLAEAKQAQSAGADAIVVQGMEAGGHRGCTDPEKAEAQLVGLFSLVPIVADAVRVPVIATGGIADARGVAAALALGASAVAIGTGFLRCPEARIAPAWADALSRTAPEDTRVTRAFSGRTGRSIATAYVHAASAPDAPLPCPYPVQRAITALMRGQAQRENSIDGIQAWAGQSALLAKALPAGELVGELWDEAKLLLR